MLISSARAATLGLGSEEERYRILRRHLFQAPTIKGELRQFWAVFSWNLLHPVLASGYFESRSARATLIAVLTTLHGVRALGHCRYSPR
jgi:hypothetical protein